MELFIFVSYIILHVTLKKAGTIHKSCLYSVLHLAKNVHICTDTFYYTKAQLNINRIFSKLQINVKKTLCKYLILPTHWHVLHVFKCSA